MKHGLNFHLKLLCWLCNKTYQLVIHPHKTHGHSYIEPIKRKILNDNKYLKHSICYLAMFIAYPLTNIWIISILRNTQQTCYI